MKNKIPILSILIFIQLFSLKAWIGCKNFFDYYHFSLFDLELQLNSAIGHDRGMDINFARIFHNKVLQFLIDIYKRYTHFFDIQLLATLISFVGIAGILFGIWYFLGSKKKDKKILTLIVLGFGIPLIDVIFNLKINFLHKLVLIAIPLNLFAAYGHIKFLEFKSRKIILSIYLIFIILSILWILILPEQASKYCVV